jgi:hypothetical protein
MNGDVIIKVSVQLPWAADVKEYRYGISRREAMDSLAPLPRKRSIDPYELFEAQRQYERRASLIKSVAQHIANAVMHACERKEADHE